VAASFPADVSSSVIAALAALAGTSTATTSLDHVVTAVAEGFRSAIPGADGVAASLVTPKQRLTCVAGWEPTGDAEEAQHELSQGPTIMAVQEGRAVRTGALARDARWPRLAGRASRLGIHSAVSIPLHTPAGVLGGVTAYAQEHDAFDAQAERAGTVFAAAAAVVIENSRVLHHVQDLAANLQTALLNRPVIDQAIGIIMSRTGVGPEEAFARLRTRSQAEHIKVADVARSVVDAAVRRARSRRATPRPPQS
jgi:transcriptional regulator with GAF, ATPase, and Fis domain